MEQNIIEAFQDVYTYILANYVSRVTISTVDNGSSFVTAFSVSG